jgi:ESF2/ABP1 family protein
MKSEKKENSIENHDDEVSEKHLKDDDNENNDIDDDDDDEDDDGSDHLKEQEEGVVTRKTKKIHKLSLTEAEDFNEKLKKRGVIYIARIPPRMTPTKIKSLLSEFGEVTRVYLVEEDASVRKRRKKELGGSGAKRYVEGWVEFANKRKAKHLALALNNTPISNHKRNPHYGKFGLYCYDMTMTCISKFKMVFLML